MKEFHTPSAQANGAEKERLLDEAAKRYTQLLRDYPEQTDIAPQALRGLGNIHAIRGNVDEAVKHYRQVAEKYPGRDWEVLQAWKAAGDLLWDANRRDEAKAFYRRIVERFDAPAAPVIFKAVVRGSKSRLAE